MPAPVGNRFWEARTTHGRDKLFETPEILLAACREYFEWVEANPLKEEKVFCNQGQITRAEITRMRAMTISGLCLFLGISEDCWAKYREREDFVGVTKQAEKIIYTQKFTGAAADMLNANIIARDLGLRDKQDLEHSGNPDKPLKTSMTVEFVAGTDTA